MKALSVKQPWASYIVQGDKNIENRKWPTNYRGRLLIHASLTFDSSAPDYVVAHHFTYGAIIGCVDVVDVVRHHESPWFSGPYGWVLENARTFTPIRWRGMPGLFEVPDEKLWGTAINQYGKANLP